MEINSEFFENIVNIVGGGIVFANAKAEVIYVNPAICDMLGYTKEEVLGKSVSFITDPADVESTQNAIKEAASKPGYEVQLEKIYLKKNGERLYGLTTVKSHEIDGQMFFSAFINDFAEQFLARKRLEKQYKNIVELADDIIFTVDPLGNFVYANEVARDLTGLSEKEILKSNYIDLVAPSHKEETERIYHTHFVKKEDKIQFTFPMISNSGQIFWLDQKLNTIWDVDRKKILGYSAVARDVTTEWETAQRLTESESHYQALFDQSPVPKRLEDFSKLKEYVESLKVSGIKDLRAYFETYPKELKKSVSLIKTVERNRQVLVLHGARTEAELKENISQIFAPQAYEAFKKVLIGIAEGRTTYETKTMVRTIDGEDRHVQFKWMVMPGYEETLKRVMVTTIDITESLLNAEAVKSSQAHYKALFQDSTIPLRLEDFSEVDKIFNTLRGKGVENLNDYFSEFPTELNKLAAKIKLVEINKKYLDLFGVVNSDELYVDSFKFVTTTTIEDFIDDLNDLYLGIKEKEFETEIVDKNGNVKFLSKKWVSLDLRKGVVGKIFISSVDITSKKLSDKKNIESGRNYQALFNESPIPLWLEDLSDVMIRVSELKSEGITNFEKYFDENFEELVSMTQRIKVLQVNQQVLKLHKASSFEELMENFPKIFTTEALQAFKGELLNLINKTPSKGVECLMNTIHGDEIVIHMKWSIMPGHEDTYDKIFFSSLDITEQYQAQEEIKNSQKRLATVFENISVPILISNPKDATIVEVNQVAIDVLGYSEVELLSMNIADLDVTHEKNYVIKALQRCYDEGLVEGETKWRNKAGEIRHVSVKNSLINIYGEDRVLSACTDITELKQLNLENERFKIAMDNAPFAIYITNADTNELIDINTTACDQLGYSREELLKLSQQDIEQIDLIQDSDKRKEHSKKLLKGEEAMIIEGVHKRKDGTVFPVKVTVNARTIEDENYIIASVFDDTWAKETNKKLQNANQALSEEVLFRKVVQRHSLDAEEKERKRAARDLHDGLGQRLTAIKLSLGAIKNSNKLEGHLAGVLGETIALVEASMGEVRAISQDILPVVLSDFGLSEGLKRVCVQVSEASGILVSFDVKGKITPLQDFVKTSLYRIGQECINNAIKYSRSKKIDVEVVHNSVQGFVQLTVRDYGVGFEPQKVKRGMGLNNIRERAEMINAEVEIKSIVKKGTAIQVKYLF